MIKVDTTVPVRSDKSYNELNRERMERLKNEPKVKVYGNVLYKEFLGDVYTFLYQENPVTIKFDGTFQEYPATIANLLNTKLADAANANTPTEMGEGDKL